MAAIPPVVHILAGPNGAGKTSLYEAFLRRLTAVEFVNADQLAFNALGRHAATLEDARLGQGLADARRTALLAQRQGFITESTFSHVSKLELVATARAAGYRVILYHVSVDSPALAVARVEARTRQGGHSVPEEKVLGRYGRNPQIIREAMLRADRAFVFDNSRLGEPPRRLISFVSGCAQAVVEDLPAWAVDLYGADIRS